LDGDGAADCGRDKPVLLFKEVVLLFLCFGCMCPRIGDAAAAVPGRFTEALRTELMNCTRLPGLAVAVIGRRPVPPRRRRPALAARDRADFIASSSFFISKYCCGVVLAKIDLR
jgi:hypothetical protein